MWVDSSLTGESLFFEKGGGGWINPKLFVRITLNPQIPFSQRAKGTYKNKFSYTLLLSGEGSGMRWIAHICQIIYQQFGLMMCGLDTPEKIVLKQIFHLLNKLYFI